MPVYEIKNPTPFPEKPAPKPKEVQEIDTIPAVARVQFHKREWQRRRWDGKKKVTGRSIPRQEKTIRDLLTRVNDDLEQSGLRIHIVLLREENDYLLEIYDCSGKDVCRVLQDVTIPLEDVPKLIKNLQDEAGLLVDVIS